MADKSFGVKELNLLNASGTPTVTSPNNLNLNANTVAISTSATVGNNLTVSGQINVGSNIKIGNAGVVTATSFVGSGANLTGISAGISTDPSNVQATWKLGGGSGSGFTFTGPGQDGSEGNPDIYLVRGQRYLFDNTTLAGSHPFEFRNEANNADYTDGVSGAQNGLQYINVQHDAPAALKYRCTIHTSSMLGNIYIVGQHLANGVNNRVLTATSAYGMNGESNLLFDGNDLTNSGGDIAAANGSQGSPSFRNYTDTDTGMFFPSANNLAFATGGFSRVVIDDNDGMIIGNGQVRSTKIGNRLTVGGPTHAGITIKSGTSSAGSLYFSDGTSGDDEQRGLVQYDHSGNFLRFYTNAVERLRIDSSGRVSIGATSGGNADTDDLIVSGSGKKGITLCSTDGSESRLTFADGLSGVSAVAGSILYTHSNDSMDFQTNTTRRLRIDSVGRVMIGTIDAGGSNADDLTVATSGNTGITIRSGTSNTGNIFFSDATSGAAQYAGAIEFYHSDNSLRFNVGNTNYLRIISTGSVRIGEDGTFTADGSADELVIGSANSGVNRGMTILNHTGQDGRICFAQAGDPDAGMIKYSHGSNVLQFYVESEEMVRLNNTSVQGTPAMQLRKPNAASNVQSHMIHLIVGGHDRGALIAGSSFGSSAIVGSISDYRVKTNIRNYTSGWDNIKALPVKIFDINKEGEEATDIKGWIAHEVQSVIPEAVIGTKDAKKADGSDDLQSLGYNVFMPDVVGALQTAMAKIETLEAKVAALEGS